MAAKPPGPPKKSSAPTPPPSVASTSSRGRSLGPRRSLAESAIHGLKLASCKYCKRQFAAERIQIHEAVCMAKSKAGKSGKGKKRGVYDSMKHRLTGTVAEEFLKHRNSPVKYDEPKLGNNWREKHNSFVQELKAARATSAHVAAGGKPADFPPPPPSDTSNYTECPYCGRRFNDAAASRHIPACKEMAHNKGSTSSKGSRSGR